MIYRSYLSHFLFLYIKFYGTIDTTIYLCIVYGDFHITTAELNKYNRDLMACKLKILTNYY